MGDFIQYLTNIELGDLLDMKDILHELGYLLSDQRRLNEVLLNRIEALEAIHLKLNKEQGKY